MKSALKHYGEMLQSIRESGTYKNERIITTPQKARIDTTEAKNVLNMCANNYLGLSDSKELIEAAKASYDKWGFGLSSVRFICGTQGLHKELEHKIANFVKMDDCILYSSCFDANGGLFETLLGPEDAVISDELNHASIIDGVRLCKAKRYRYKNNNMEDLRAQLQDAKDSGCKIKLIATDGVFSMDGYIANLKGICDLADEFDALVMVDDSHAVGFMGEHGRGTAEYCGVEGRVDIITGTLGKALGGASGGYTADTATVLQKLYYDIAAVQEIVGESTPLVITIRTGVKAILAMSDKVQKKLDVTEFEQGDIQLKINCLDGMYPLIAVGTDRMRTSYLFRDGKSSDQKQGGFTPAGGAKTINWIITPRSAPIAVSKTDRMRIFDPETNQKARAWAMDYRKFHDLWITDEKVNQCFVNIEESL